MKSGIDYFPLDVTLDEKFELIEAEFGLTGFGVVVKLLQRIYGGQGYYVEWTNEVALLFAKRIGLGGSVVSEIVEASIKRGIFDKTLYDKYHILTSSGIQKRYFEAVGRRKSVEVEGRYLLVDATLFSKNVVIKDENAYIFGKNVDISQQSREEESRVEKSRGEELPPPPCAYGKALQDFLSEHPNVIVDNCSSSCLDLDYSSLSREFSASSWLREQEHDLSWVERNAPAILRGRYRDRRGTSGNDAVYAELYAKYDEEEKLKHG